MLNHHEIQNMMAEWQSVKNQATALAEREMELRKRLVEILFPNDAAKKDSEGVRNFDLSAGWKAKATFKLYYNLGKFEDVARTMTAIRNLGTVDAATAFARLVKYKPELSGSEYRKCEGPVKKLIDGVLTISPGAPTLEFIPPK